MFDGTAETRSLSDPGSRIAVDLPNVGGASAAATAVVIPQQQQVALLVQGDLSLVPVHWDLNPAHSLQQQRTVLAQANPSHGVPVTYVPGSGEASSSTASELAALRALGRVPIEHEIARTQDAEGNARREAVILMQQNVMAC